MEEMIANTTDAAVEKHVPVYEKIEDELVVKDCFVFLAVVLLHHSDVVCECEECFALVFCEVGETHYFVVVGTCFVFVRAVGKVNEG